MDPIVFLLAGAAAALVILPVTSKIRVGKTRIVSTRREFFILWSRWLVGALCLGAASGLALANLGYPSLTAGGLMALVVLIPASIYFGVRWLLSHWHRRARDRQEEEFLKDQADDSELADSHKRERENATKSEPLFGGTGGIEGASAGNATRSAATVPAKADIHPGGSPAPARPEATLILASSDSDRAETQDAALVRNLANIDENVRTVTLGEDPVDGPSGLADVPPASREASFDPSLQMSSVSDDVDEEDIDFEAKHLATMDAHQMRAMVVNLRAEKHKLQKLVLAQKASLDAEREAHNKTHDYAKATAEELQGSLLKQQRVVKIARRERAQRIKLEDRLDGISRNLSNMQSMLSQQTDAFEQAEA